MSGRDDARTMLEAILGYAADDHNPSAPEDRGPKIGTVDPAFDGTTAGARITFDGEGTMSARSYPWLGEAPTPGARVVLLPVGRSYVILDAIGQATDYRRPWREAGGIATMPAVASTPNGGLTAVTVQLPAGRFTQPPIVTLGPGTTRLNLQVDTITATSFRIGATNWTSGAANNPTPVHWHAYQAFPASAAG